MGQLEQLREAIEAHQCAVEDEGATRKADSSLWADSDSSSVRELTVAIDRHRRAIQDLDTGGYDPLSFDVELWDVLDAVLDDFEITGAELRCRRLALGLDQSDLAAMLDVKQILVSRWETSKRITPPGVVLEITQREDEQDALTAGYIESGRELGELYAHPNEEEFWRAQPHMRGVPLAVQHVAVARARRVLNTPIIDA